MFYMYFMVKKASATHRPKSSPPPPDPSLPVSGVDVPMSSGADGPAADMEVEAATLLDPPPLKIQALRLVTTYCAPSSTATYREEN